MAKHHQKARLSKWMVIGLVITILSITSLASAQEKAKDSSNIQYDMMLLNIMEQAHMKESGVNRYPQNRFIILPHRHQGQTLEIRLPKEIERLSTLIYEIHDMKGTKIMEGILPQNRLVDISTLNNKLHVITLRSVDNLMKFNLVVD